MQPPQFLLDLLQLLLDLAVPAAFCTLAAAGVSPVSYTHLDVYKRQEEVIGSIPIRSTK